MNSTTTKVLYLTQNCNLKCSYCYELGHHKKRTISKKEINRFLSDLIQETGTENQTSICFFGGEPFLAFDKILYTVERCREINSRTGKGFAFNVITNGTLLYDYVPELYDLTHDSIFNFTIHVSYDGSFQYLRTGKSKIVEENMNRLLDFHVPFGISYTISIHNADYKVLTKDLISIIRNYLPVENENETIRLNWDYSKLHETGADISLFQSKFREYLLCIYKKFGVPICYEVCEYCGRCIIPQSKSRAMYVVPNFNSPEIRYQEQNYNGRFNVF